MPTRPDLRALAASVREAFADADKDTLLDVLTFVVKEYVVEGPPPMLVHQVENLPDLAGLSFAQLVTALQTRLDHAELAMFAVDGEQVSVRVGGVMHPILPTRTAPAAADLPRPAAGVRVVETTLSRTPPAPARPAADPAPAGTAPPPSRGLAMRGRPSGEGAGPGGDAPAAASGGAAAAPGAAAPAAPAAPDKESAGGDDGSARFSLLELD